MLLDLLLESKNKKPKVKITIKHPDVLEIPEGKHFWQMPIKHYVNLCKKKTYAEIVKALVNLKVWNKKKHPDIAAKADKILDKLKDMHEKGKI